MAEDKDNQYVAGKTEKILSPREYIGEPNTGYAEVNQFNRPNEEHLGERPFGQEYPISKGPRYTAAPVTEIGKVTGRADTQEEQIFQAAVDHRLGAGSEHRNKNDFFGYDSNGNPIYGQKIRRGVHAVDKDGRGYDGDGKHGQRAQVPLAHRDSHASRQEGKPENELEQENRIRIFREHKAGTQENKNADAEGGGIGRPAHFIVFRVQGHHKAVDPEKAHKNRPVRQRFMVGRCDRWVYLVVFLFADPAEKQTILHLFGKT